MSNKYKTLKLGGASVYEHRVVVENTLGRKLRENEIVHHIDGNKRNNDPSNLVVMTRAEHSRIHRADIDRSKPVLQIDRQGRVVAVWPSARAACRAIPEASYQNIYKCCRGVRKTAGGFFWEYANESVSDN